MAKKKRKHRRPVAPPVHSAPETLHAPGATPSMQPPPARPITPEPPPTASEPWTHATPARPTTRAPRRRPSSRRRGRGRTYLIAGTVLALIVAAIVARQVLSSRRTTDFNELARASGCSEIRVTGTSGGGQHLAQFARQDYDTSPPTHGPHDGKGVLPAGIYDKPFNTDPRKQPSIYRAVHSLEHGYVIGWLKGLTREQGRELERRYRGERKVILVPYEFLRGKTKMALTAWGRIVECERPSTRVIDAFIELYREARSAPEPKGA